ncbi:ATP-binding protein [Micromonospora sp. NPDC002296]|uniref:ATP-binding protein n=1 Tax=Micromonospora sp. NPDC002296 TaxID=3154271 RepID=UPI00332C7E21
MTVNPYLGVGQVATAERFVGRRDLLRLLENSWRGSRPANLSLQGNHRMGKTSVVRRAQELFAVDRPDLLVVYLSVAAYESGADVFRAVVARVRQEAERLNQSGDGAPPDWLAGLNDIELSVHSSTEWLDLKECFEAFFTALHRVGVGVGVILDEFDQAEAFRRVEFQLLRDLVSEKNYSAGLVTLSRRSIKSIELAAVAHSTLDGVMGMRRPVGPFRDDEVAAMLARADDAGVDLTDLRPEIVRRAGNHPYLIELFCHELVETHLTDRLDAGLAWEQVESQFRDQFTRSIANLNADTGERGGDLLYQVLTRTYLTIDSQDIALLRRLGLVRPDGATVALLSPEFAQQVRRMVLTGSLHGWWIDRDLALRAHVRERLTRSWGEGWGAELSRRAGGAAVAAGRWHGGPEGVPLVPADRLDPLDRLDTAEVIDLVLLNWELFEAHLGGDPAAWKERAEAVTQARQAADRGSPLDADLRRRAEHSLDGLPPT